MEKDPAFLIRAINEVKESIWLGDYAKAIETADSNLDVAKRFEFIEFENTANEVRQILRQFRKEAKQKNMKNRRFWVAEQVSKSIEEKKLDSQKNLFGSLLIYLYDLREAIAYLSEIKSQTTMETYADKTQQEDDSLQRTDRCRYSIKRFPERWEVRSILDKDVLQWNTEILRKELPDFVFSIEEAPKERRSTTFEIYSREMYAQVVGQDNQVEMSIYTPGTPDARTRVRKVIETILNTLGQ
jgi:hypothetical protein